ncbi:4Fe-4S dicluster domain-containing protein [Limnochorda pilosa]|uniref:Tungsten formylmethanofuran dehydrogenase n=1 Tax=Limnochorda pilosa TaxID=1555112 RepID=A0A0K2SPV4_LIMPI|nr:4Fe-4S dicluster domain-containing protein [Limnochorda pilosa]BAS29136.1 tungsten formylmethanofuran dehydrogenase [Limnochorda pilosa]
MEPVIIDQERCKGCELCLAACGPGVLELSEAFNSRGYRYSQLTDPDRCTSCAQCARVCPEAAIAVYKLAS